MAASLYFCNEMKRRNINDEFELRDIAYSNIAKALGHPARIQIIKSLMKSGSLTVKEIVVQLPLSQSTVSQHLQKLKSAGLVDMQPYKTSSLFTVNFKTLNMFSQMHGEVFAVKKEDRQLSLF